MPRIVNTAAFRVPAGSHRPSCCTRRFCGRSLDGRVPALGLGHGHRLWRDAGQGEEGRYIHKPISHAFGISFISSTIGQSPLCHHRHGSAYQHYVRKGRTSPRPRDLDRRVGAPKPSAGRDFARASGPCNARNFPLSSPIVLVGLQQTARLYKIEEEIRDLFAGERQAARWQHSAPIVNTFGV